MEEDPKKIEMTKKLEEMKKDLNKMKENNVFEQPKGVQNMQSEMTNTETKNTNSVNVSNKPTNKNSFIKKYIIFILLLIVVTGLAIFFTIRNLGNEENQTNEEENVEEINTNYENIQTEIGKKKAEDAKYGLQKYSEEYDENDVKLLNYVDVDGKIDVYENIYQARGNSIINFIQIDGLKNKTVQNNINDRLKSECYKLNLKNVYSTVTANFSNVLSVMITGNNENSNVQNKCLNIDLVTGEDIPFEKVFVSSAPINTYLSEGLNEVLAWDARATNTNEENWEETFDISKIDISQFEDKSILLINNYKKAKEKGELQYIITPNKVSVYNLLNSQIVESENLREACVDIKFESKIEEIAIYKRYLTDTSIFEQNDIGFKNIIVLTNPNMSYDKNIRNMNKILNYGKVSDNIFMEEVIDTGGQDENEGYKNIINYFQNISNDTKKNLNANPEEGLIYQKIISIYQESRDAKYYVTGIEEIKVTCTREYFDNLAFKDYSNNKNQPSSGPRYIIFSEWESREYPNLKITSNENKNNQNHSAFPRLYFSLDGKFIGNTEEEAKSEIDKQEAKERQSQELNNTYTNNVNTTINNNTSINRNNTTTNNIMRNTYNQNRTNNIINNNSSRNNTVTNTNRNNTVTNTNRNNTVTTKSSKKNEI